MKFDELRIFLGERLTTSKAIRLEYSLDESWHIPANIPDAVLYPKSTGEHGIGIGKKEYLKTEKGSSISVILQIKKAIDPKNIMNPGKIFHIL